MEWTGERVLEALGLTGVPLAGLRFRRVCTDTRVLVPGDLFVALAGERFDGHDHLESARDAGAGAAVVREGTPPLEGLPLIPVPDTVRALGALAAYRRRAVPGPVVAITGTNGKTSTKEMMAAVLRTRYRTHATPANQNNLIGVPLTVLEAPAGTEALVVEAGASLPGEIGRYREILHPDVAIITNAVEGHLEGFGSQGGVLQEKLALTDGVPLAVVGTEPAGLPAGARERAAVVRMAGLAGAGLVPDRMELGADGRARVEVDGVAFTVGVPGAHQAGNAMLVWAVARELGIDLRAAGAALGEVQLPGGRVEVQEHGRMTVVNDAYNANPQSFRAAIALARAIRGARRLVFVAGTMLELGEFEARLHDEVAADLAGLGADLLLGVGAFVRALAPHRATLGGRLVLAADTAEAGRLLPPLLRGDELVVLKASRGVALERILPDIVACALPAS
jgi:UDP-N-acetylmuramoyl-tripeptide--D-alanyl-D-alanine ligase